MNAANEKLVTLPEAKALLEKRRKDGPLGYEQQNTFDYLEEFVVVSEKDAKEMEKELGKLGFLSEAQIAGVINNMPRFENEVRAVMTGGEKGGATSEQAKQVLKIVKDYSPKK